VVKPLNNKSEKISMKVLVTGGTGFIGSNLLTALVKSGHDISCLVRSNKLNESKIKIIKGDLTEPTLSISDTFDVVYHLAAAWVGEKDKKVQKNVNYNGTINLFNAVKDRTKTIVYVSGLGVFGDTKGKIIDENSKPNPNTDYAKIRLEAQNFLECKCKENGINFTVAYLGDVYGNGGWFTNVVLERLRKGAFRIPGSGKYYRSFIHVDDVSTALVSIIEKNAVNQSFIVTDSNPTTFLEFINYVSKKVGVKEPGTIPTILAKAVLGADFVNMLTTSIRTSNSKILKICNFQYPSYQQGIDAVFSELTV
jgi:nucleoside-diphosphate-sugar epimerase